jgi:acetylornithine deacetylase/succinyl-diaminopimelate desuccinylase-like protein
MDNVKQYIAGHRDAFERDLSELLRIASVSADSRQNGETKRAADWVAGQFKGLGLETETIPTAGHPLVYAESPAVPGKPVVLVYGHYDVQPPEPFDEWISLPFEPTVRDGNIYARGATDDKGQMLTHVKSAEAWIKAVGILPLQLKFLI